MRCTRSRINSWSRNRSDESDDSAFQGFNAFRIHTTNAFSFWHFSLRFPVDSESIRFLGAMPKNSVNRLLSVVWVPTETEQVRGESPSEEKAFLHFLAHTFSSGQMEASSDEFRDSCKTLCIFSLPAINLRKKK